MVILSSVGVPAGAALTLNVTAVSPSGDGYFGVFPCGSDVPGISSLNYTTNSVVPNYVTVGIGCTGGRHRSVYFAEQLAGRLSAEGFAVRASHRDVER